MPATPIKIRETLYRVSAPHYVAGLIVRGFFVVQAAPILKWAIGKRWLQVQLYFIKKGYEVAMI